MLDGGQDSDILFIGQGGTAMGGEETDTFVGGTELLTGTAAVRLTGLAGTFTLADVQLVNVEA